MTMMKEKELWRWMLEVLLAVLIVLFVFGAWKMATAEEAQLIYGTGATPVCSWVKADAKEKVRMPNAGWHKEAKEKDGKLCWDRPEVEIDQTKFDQKKFDIRTRQTNMLAAKLVVRDAQDALARAVQQEKDSERAFQDEVDGMYKDLGISKDDFALCGGPAPGDCAGVPDNDIQLKKKSKKADESNKDEAK